MLRIRPGLRGMLRGATPEEYAAIHLAAAERQQMSAEERSGFTTPDEADRSIGGALLWSSLVVWQDNPRFVAIGLAGLIVSTGCRIWECFK